MTQVYPPQEQVHKNKSRRQDGMQSLSVKEEQHYTAPLPEAASPPFHPFPARVMSGLGIGALLGSLLGLVIGLLLQRNLLVVPGWEALYSMGPFTFVFFWVVMGLAFGVTTIGTGAILSARVDHQPEPDTEEDSQEKPL